MSSNYPPGVTGNEPQITGPPEPVQSTVERVTEMCLNDLDRIRNRIYKVRKTTKQLAGNLWNVTLSSLDHCYACFNEIKRLELEMKRIMKRQAASLPAPQPDAKPPHPCDAFDANNPSPLGEVHRDNS